MTIELSPWAERFAEISNPDFIRERCEVFAQPLFELNELSVEEACDLLKTQLANIFLVTTSNLKVLLMLAERTISYAKLQYPNERHFLGRCYEQLADDFESAPVCVTGLAGIGKTHIRKAFFRLLPRDTKVQVTSHGEFPMSAARLIVVKSRKSVLDIYRSLARPGLDDKSLRGETAWLKDCQKWLYQSGVCAVFSDELQFLTQGEKANTLLAQALMGMSFLGPPVVFNGNYSLVHRLLKRPQEERQRLLTRVYVLHPDNFDSDAWTSVLKEFQAAAPGIFSFRLENEAKTIWSLTAGIKRVLAQLLVLAYRHVRDRKLYCVSMDDLNAAYHSLDFFTQRKDVELLFAGTHQASVGRTDLSCPFPASTPEAENYRNALNTARRNKVADAVARAVMTQEERLRLQTMQIASQPIPKPKLVAKVVKLIPKSVSALEALKSAGLEFKKDLS